MAGELSVGSTGPCPVDGDIRVYALDAGDQCEEAEVVVAVHFVLSKTKVVFFVIDEVAKNGLPRL
jgi:hypothetical protein